MRVAGEVLLGMEEKMLFWIMGREEAASLEVQQRNSRPRGNVLMVMA